MTIGVALWARKIATSLPTSSAVDAGEAGGAHEDQRLRRQVDVLLVLGDVAGDRLVAELAELDPHLLGGDLVGAVADDGPVALGRREPAGRVGDRRSRRASTVRIASGSVAQRREQLVAALRRSPTPAASLIAQASSVPAATWA